MQLINANPKVAAQASAKGRLGAPEELSKDEIDRVFAVDGDVVSLKVLPKTEKRDADGIVMLLWGFSHMKNLTQVPAGDLKAGAKKSGISDDRIDRISYANREYIQKGGSRRWTRYGLTNPGADYAITVIKGMLA